ncbi:MAG TPA: sugar phosphate isomerase/epimerase family protein [Opitutaceae bacterium]|nr:sugar phosphate isomerase/epimerase family protein [Opitutaceae bacterium]
MKLGLSSYTYVWATGVPGFPQPKQPLTAFDLLERARELGVRVVQLADHMPVHRLSDLEIDRLRERASELQIDIELGTSGIAPDHLQTYLRLATRLRAKLLRTVTDTAGERPTPGECVALLRQTAPRFADAGVVLALENHDRFKAATLRQIVEETGSPHVGICLDTANSLGCSEGSDTVLETLGPVTANLHIKDYTARRLPHRFGFSITGTPAGAGDLDISHWLRRLREMGRECNAIIELWPPPDATLDESIEKENRWAIESVAFMRTLISE